MGPLGTVQSYQAVFETNHLKEHIMNIAKNMEIIFVAATVIAAATSYATASDVRAPALAPVAKVAVAEVKMPVVTVTAKRLTAAEKAAL
jgi:hypothetical protein